MREKCFHIQINEYCKAEEDNGLLSGFFSYPLSLDLSEMGFHGPFCCLNFELRNPEKKLSSLW